MTIGDDQKVRCTASFRTRFGIYKPRYSVDAESSSAWRYSMDEDDQ